jgi:O-antigen/teichoic acid export membrane protein
VAIEDRASASDDRIVDRQSGMAIVAAMVVANLANYGFQIMLGRALSIEEYGLLAGFMTVLTVITVAGTALQTTAARAIATGEHHDRYRFFDGLTRSSLLVAAGLVVLSVLALPVASSFFNIGALPLLLLGLFVVPAVLDSIALGRYQGLQRFTDLATYSTAQAMAKLFTAAIVLMLGFRATGLVAGLVVTSGVVAFVGLQLSREAGSLEVTALDPDVRRALAAYTMLWFILGADVLFARAFFVDTDAGIYAAAAVLGKAVLWIPVMIGQLIFPRLARRSKGGESVETLAYRSVILVIGVVGVAVLGLRLFGEPVFGLLYGDRYAVAADTAWKIGLAMAPLALVNLLIQHFLARQQSRFLGWMLFVLVVESLTMYVGPKTHDFYVLVLGSSGLVVLLVMVPGYAWSRLWRRLR